MRILIDGRMACWTGVGRYVTGLCGALPRIADGDEFLLLLNPGEEVSRIPEAGNLEKVRARRPIPPYSLAEQTRLKREIARHRPDLVHAPQFNVPRLGRWPFVVTIHDLIYLLFPGDCPSRFAHWGVRRMIRSAVRRARKVLTNSEYTRADLVRLLGVDAGRTRVTHLGPPALPEKETDPRVAREKFGLPESYLLYTGNHAPHKNLETVLKTLPLLAREGVDIHFVVTGPMDRHTPSVVRIVRSLGLEDKVHLTGSVEDPDLYGLYRGASVLVFPSLYEGFGLPPLEAFAVGVPVVASKAASIPEVLGDAALLVDPLDAGKYKDAILKVLSDAVLRESLVARGRERLERYSWETMARATLEVYREALG
ncbi:MAG: glycosyltransferase family 4 protein [Planctomycetota bacterium]|jgi:glycosyltransferase involved in cell wall biosynthesis